jgi:hypothetical protein
MQQQQQQQQAGGGPQQPWAGVPQQPHDWLQQLHLQRSLQLPQHTHQQVLLGQGLLPFQATIYQQLQVTEGHLQQHQQPLSAQQLLLLQQGARGYGQWEE